LRNINDHDVLRIQTADQSHFSAHAKILREVGRVKTATSGPRLNPAIGLGKDTIVRTGETLT